jgi:two-component system CheB/CheR fusion protein
VAHITTTLVYPELRTDVGTVLQTLVFIEKEIPTSDGHWFVTRIMPYRTLDNTIDGVVITFMDITRTKELEAELRRSLTAKKEREA